MVDMVVGMGVVMPRVVVVVVVMVVHALQVPVVLFRAAAAAIVAVAVVTVDLQGAPVFGLDVRAVAVERS